MEKGLQRKVLEEPVAVAQPAPTPAPEPKDGAANDGTYAPPAANDPVFRVNSKSLRPKHTETGQELSPTSEFMRYLLAALPSRYVFRGAVKTMYDTEAANDASFRSKVTRVLQKPGALIERLIFGRGARDASTIKENLSTLEHGSYGAALGFGSLALTYSYSRLVARSITNLFAETVAEELDKPVEKITFEDIRHSQNKIVQRTITNYYGKMFSRFATDLLFFPAALMRKEGLVDMALGVKGVQLFIDTWKRKTTMFEDLVTFVNNKINPRNGLGQPINVGEIFDLYQHYTETFHPNQMFTNVLERGTGEGVLWAQSQPIFVRMTELMNLTYAYKHSTVIDPKTGHAIHQADFALPKFIYLLGHDLIDVRQPERTLATIEIANKFGITAVEDMQAMLKSGKTLGEVVQRYPVPTATQQVKKIAADEKNTVIAKGSTMQLDQAEGAAPLTTIAANSVMGTQPMLPQQQAAVMA